MSTIIGSNLSSLLTSARKSYVAYGLPGVVQVLAEDSQEPSVGSPSTIVSLSDQAKAYLAQSSQSAAADETSLTSIAADARAWFNQQYQKLGISSAKMDGKIAVDFTGQSRAWLSAVASNAQGAFSRDESEAAKSALQSRFDDAVSPHAVIARHTGNYTRLYDAALAYMNEAEADERATSTWQEQFKALTEGAAAARRNPSKAPDTGNANDMVRALLDKETEAPSSADAAGRARTLLNNQIADAKNGGTDLVFDKRRKVGQQADFSQFDNRMLAAVALNQGSSFSPEEAYAAKTELNSRTRLSLLEAITSGNGSDPSAGAFAMIKQYSIMSGEEKAVLGVTDPMMDRLVRNYQGLLSVRDALSGQAGIGAYL